MAEKMPQDALDAADLIAARLLERPASLHPWRYTRLILGVGLDLGLTGPGGEARTLRLTRPGGPARLRLGPSGAGVGASIIGGETSVSDRALADLLAPWKDVPIAWPAWDPLPRPLIVTGGVPRAGSGRVDRIARTILGCGGHTPGSTPGPPRATQVVDDFTGIEAALAAHRASPDRVRMLKALYWPGTPDPDAPSRHLFAIRAPLDVLWSQLRGMMGREGLDRGFALDALLQESVPRMARALAAAPAGPGTRLVSYEALSADPEGEIGQIAGFFGIALPPTWIAHIAAQHSFEAESGRAAGQEIADAYHRSGRIGEGRAGFTEAEVAKIRASAPGLFRP